MTLIGNITNAARRVSDALGLDFTTGFLRVEYDDALLGQQYLHLIPDSRESRQRYTK